MKARLAIIVLALGLVIGCSGPAPKEGAPVPDHGETTTTTTPEPRVLATFDEGGDYGDEYEVVELELPDSNNLVCVTWKAHGPRGTMQCFLENELGIDNR